MYSSALSLRPFHCGHRWPDRRFDAVFVADRVMPRSRKAFAQPPADLMRGLLHTLFEFGGICGFREVEIGVTDSLRQRDYVRIQAAVESGLHRNLHFYRNLFPDGLRCLNRDVAIELGRGGVRLSVRGHARNDKPEEKG